MTHSTSTTIRPMTIQVTTVEDINGPSEGYHRRQSMVLQGRREAARRALRNVTAHKSLLGLRSSLQGLTRQSIHLRKEVFTKEMDARVNRAHDRLREFLFSAHPAQP